MARVRDAISICRFPEMYAPVSDAGQAMMSARSALGHQVAAMASGAGAEVDHVIGAADGVFVVLDHQHGVAEVAQVSSASIRRLLSRWWRPMEGSSST